jgi:hypothetical protein
MEVLAADPVMVDSGQFEPILDKPRTYADVQNQIATDLANLPQYHARCKLGHTELVLQTVPLPQPVSDTVFAERTNLIVARTRSDYCKPRQVVEEEITTRQEKLIKLEVKQQRTVQEGEV